MKYVVKIAIVGAEENKWKPEQKIQAKNIIRTLLTRHAFCETLADEPFADTSREIDWSKIVLVSGHCPKGGVDIWAENTAEELGIKTEIYAPEVFQWNDEICEHCEGMGRRVLGEGMTIGTCPNCGGKGRKIGFHSRNIQIAKACDILYDIEPTHSCRYCGGKGKRVPTTFPENSFGEKTCPFCEGDGAYSGGTWTLKYARKLGKEVHKIIIKEKVIQ